MSFFHLQEYYDKQKRIYQEVWDDEGRICWGFFPELESSTFKEAGLYHVERMCGVHNGKRNATEEMGSAGRIH